MKTILITTMLLVTYSMSVTAQVHVVPVQTKAHQDAVEKAKKVITDYFATATAQDKHVFSEYLKNYKSAGGYQAVTPAKQEILKAVEESKALQAAFARVKEIAQQFTQEKQTMPGASSLTPEGEAFYAELIRFVNKLLINK